MQPKKRILVIGGAGYIGSACTRELLEQGYSVAVLDSLRTGQKDKIDSRASFFECDILNKSDLDAVFTTVKPEVVMHFAALKAAGESELQPADYFETNVSGTINILTAMSKHKVPQIIFSSTASVYTPTSDGVYSETSSVGSINVYGSTKLIAEKIISEFRRTKQIEKYTILRYFNVAGDVGLHFKERRAQNVFPILANALTTNSEFSVFGTDYETRDGTCVRDYIHLSDLVDAHVMSIDASESSIINLGTKQGTTVLELVHSFESLSGKSVNVVYSNRRFGDPAVVIADPTLSKKIIKWEAKRTLDDMVKSTLDAFSA